MKSEVISADLGLRSQGKIPEKWGPSWILKTGWGYPFEGGEQQAEMSDKMAHSENFKPYNVAET